MNLTPAQLLQKAYKKKGKTFTGIEFKKDLQVLRQLTYCMNVCIIRGADLKTDFGTLASNKVNYAKYLKAILQKNVDLHFKRNKKNIKRIIRQRTYSGRSNKS